MASLMAKLKRSGNQLYTEAEAATALGISVARLHQLLDEHIFTKDSQRPSSIQFTSSDLLLLSYWSQETKRPVKHEVIAMPKRN